MRNNSEYMYMVLQYDIMYVLFIIAKQTCTIIRYMHRERPIGMYDLQTVAQTEERAHGYAADNFYALHSAFHQI